MMKILLGFFLLAVAHANVINKVNGGWSDWFDYLTCSTSCGTGIKKRWRFCTNPAPSSGGKDCIGEFLETAICNSIECPINGGWSDWSEYSACSASCGGGTKTQTRSCTNPAPSRGGNDCAGDASQTATCNLSECPINGGWSDWSEYSVCSASCGGGTKTQTRSCTNPAPSRGGNGCAGDSSATATCSLSECPINGGWSDWGDYSACSASCGSCAKKRTRTCTNPAPSRGGNGCAGEFLETAICNSLECPTRIGEKYMFQSNNYPKYRIGIKDDYTASIIENSLDEFRVVKALNGRDDSVSFQSIKESTKYLRHHKFILKLHPVDLNSEVFKNESSFIMRDNYYYPGFVSIESTSKPGYFLRHTGYTIKLHEEKPDDELYKKDASFKLVQSELCN